MEKYQEKTREELLTELKLLKEENRFLKGTLETVKIERKERKKELRCHEQVASVINNTSFTRKQVMSRIVNIIPPAWQFPDKTSAIIVTFGKEYKSKGFTPSKYEITKNIQVNEKVIGRISVYYTGELNANLKEPFLPEEHMLLGSLSEMLSIYLNEEQKRSSIAIVEQRFSELVENIGDIIFEVNDDLEISFISNSVKNVLGYEPDELIGNKITSIVYPEDLPLVLSKIKKSGPWVSRKMELRVVSIKNEQRWVRVETNLLKRNGKIVGRTGIFHDIEDEKKAQLKLEESEFRFRNIVESINEVIYEVDLTGKIVFVSRSVKHVLSFEKEEVIGQNIFEFVYEEDLPMVREAMATLATRDYKFLEYRYKDRSGAIRWVRSATSPIYRNGKITGGTGLLSDITDRKLAEQELKEREEAYRTLVENINDIVFETDENAILQYISPQIESILDYRSSELIGTSIFNYIDELKDVMLQRFGRLSKGGSSKNDYTFKTKTGEHHWLGVSSRAKVKEGKFIGIFGTITDIHNQKLLEIALQKSEEMYRSLVENTYEVIFDIDLDGTINYLSPRIEHISGYTSEELSGKNIYDFMHPDDKAMVNERLSLILEQPFVEIEYRFLKKDKTVYWISSSASPTFKNDELVGVKGAMSDITKRKEYEQQILKLTLVVEQSPVSILITNLEGNIEYANPKACETTGYEQNELIGKNPCILKSGETSAQEYEMLWNKISTGLAWHGLFHNKKKSGEYYWESAQIAPIRNKDGEILGYFAVKEDITERINAENELIKSERRFKQVAEQNQTVIWEVNDEGLYTYVSPVVAQIWSYKPEELVGKKHFYDLHPAEGRKEFKAAAFKVFSEKGIFKNTENLIVDGNNATRWMITNGVPILDEKGRLIGYRGSDMDITNKKEYELAINEQNAKLNAIIKAIPDLIFIMNDEGQYLEYFVTNKQELFLRPENIIGSSVYDVFDESKAQFLVHQIKKSIATKTVISTEYTIEKDGIQMFYEARFSPLNGKKVLIVSRNISENRRQELQLKKLSLAVTQSPVITVVTDVNANIEYVNPAFEKVTGYKFEDVLGQNVRILQSGNTNRAIYRELWETIKDGKVWEGEWMNKKKNGELYWEGVLVSPILDDERRIINYLAVKQDITTRKETEKALAELNATLEQKVEERTEELEKSNLRLLNEIEVRALAEKNLEIQKERLSHIIDGGMLGTWEWNVQTGQTSFNEKWAEIVGYTLEELSPISIDTWTRLTHPDDLKRSETALQKHFNKETNNYDIELRMRHKNGDWIWIEDSGKVVSWDDKGKPLNMFGIHQNITKRKLAEGELKWNKSLLEMMAGSSPLGFLVVDNRTDEILYYNQRFCEIWNIEHLSDKLKSGQLKNNDIISYLIPSLADARAFAESCKPLQDENNRNVVADEIPFIGNRTVSRYSTQIRSNTDEYYGRFYIFEDITERKRVEQFDNELLTLSSELTGLAYEDLNAAINLALQRIGNYLDADRAYVFEFDSDQTVMHNTYEWCAEGISAEIENLQDVPCAIFPNWLKKLKKHENILIPSVKDLGTGWEAEKEILEPQGVKSLVVMPLLLEHKLVGFVGLDSVRNYREYSVAEMNTLKVWSVMLSNLLQSKRTELLLQQTRKDYETFFDTTEDLLIIVNKEGPIIHTNKAVERRLGFTSEELLLKSIATMHQPESYDEIEQTYKNLLGKGAYINNLPLLTKEKSLIPVETRIVKGTWNGEDVFLGISRDITERLKAQEDLRRSEARWQFAIESSGDGIWDLDLIERQIYFSPNWIKLLGYENEPEINNPEFLRKIIHADDLKQFLIQIEAHLKGDTKILESDFRARDKQGEYKWIIAKGRVISYNNQGIPSRMIGTLTDISTRKNYELSLAESLRKERELSELKSRFVSMTSHEFRTPLATILMSAEIIESYRFKMSDTDINQKIKRIKDNVNFLRNVMEKVLNLAHIESGKMKFQPKPVDFYALLNEIVDDFKDSGNLKHEIDYTNREDKLTVHLDPQMIKQTFRNLISNSLKYAPEGSTIGVAIEKTKEAIKVHVEDKGIGIKEEDFDRIFQPFNRGLNVGNIHGTGLGLSLSKSFIQYHGGDITFVSEPNVKTVFTVTIPLR
jgi:PAS domain S-box-containing protein